MQTLLQLVMTIAVVVYGVVLPPGTMACCAAPSVQAHGSSPEMAGMVMPSCLPEVTPPNFAVLHAECGHRSCFAAASQPVQLAVAAPQDTETQAAQIVEIAGVVVTANEHGGAASPLHESTPVFAGAPLPLRL